MKRPQPAPRRSSASSIMLSKSVDSSISISIGQGDSAQEFHIPHAARRACAYLQKNLEDGSSLPYVDPKSFKAVIDFLGMNVLEKMSGADSTAFTPLFEAGDAMLKFAQTWALGHEFELPEFQNRLVDAYSRWYAKLVSASTPVRTSPEAFAWLRNAIANHTPAEKFLVDFAAGMRRFEDAAPPDPTMDKDIAGYIANRWALLAAEGDKADRILNADAVFKVAKTDRHVQSRTLKIVSPPETPPVSPAVLRRPAAARAVSSASVHTVRLFKSNNSSLLSFPPPASLDRESELREESSDDSDSVDFSRFPEVRRKGSG